MQVGGRARGAAHFEHPVHNCGARGVEAQRLVERRRLLPSIERRACGVGRGMRVGRRERRRATAVQAACRKGLDCGLVAAHEERTRNMWDMVVTLEVLSKLSGWLKDAAPCRESKEGHTVWGK